MATLDRFTGGDARVQLFDANGGAIIEESATSNVDELIAEYMPDIQKSQPLGQPQKINRLSGYEWQVTVTGTIFANGLSHLAQLQANAYDRGEDVPLLKLEYRLAHSGTTVLGTVHHVFTEGLITRQTDTLRTEVTAQVVILFRKRSPS